MKLPTDCVKFTEPISARVSPVVAETVHTDGTRVLQYQSDDQKSIKTTEGQMPMDYLEIPEPRLPRGFLDLAEEARNVKVESGRSWYTEEVQSQGTGLTRLLCYCYGIQFTCTTEGGRESHRCLYRDDTNHGFCWTT